MSTRHGKITEADKTYDCLVRLTTAVAATANSSGLVSTLTFDLESMVQRYEGDSKCTPENQDHFTENVLLPEGPVLNPRIHLEVYKKQTADHLEFFVVFRAGGKWMAGFQNVVEVDASKVACEPTPQRAPRDGPKAVAAPPLGIPLTE